MSAAGGKYIGDFNNKNTDFIFSYHSGGKADGKEIDELKSDSSMDYLNRYQNCKEDIINRMK